jgi:hypothetical protein
MTIAQVHREFLLQINKIASLANANFYSFTIDEYLTKAQEVLIDRFYPYNKQNNAGLEATAFNISALTNFTISSPEIQGGLVPIEIVDGKYNINLGDLDFEFLFPIKLEAQVSELTDPCKIPKLKTIRCDLFQNDDVKNRINQPSWLYNKIHHKFGYSNDNSLFPRYGSVFFDTTNVKEVKQYNLDKAFISYLRRPTRVWLGNYDLTTDLLPDSGTNIIYKSGVDVPVNLEFPEHFHKDVIEIAAELAIRDIKRS